MLLFWFHQACYKNKSLVPPNSRLNDKQNTIFATIYHLVSNVKLLHPQQLNSKTIILPTKVTKSFDSFSKEFIFRLNRGKNTEKKTSIFSVALPRLLRKKIPPVLSDFRYFGLTAHGNLANRVISQFLVFYLPLPQPCVLKIYLPF